MTPPDNRRWLLRGVTSQGKRFRPSDWCERLAGVMSGFRPGGSAHTMGYSPWCIPTTRDGDACVIVDPALRALEPMAWDFVVGFARDNDLQVEVLDD
jgi:hypothetical protein